MWRARRGPPDPAAGRTAGLQNLSRSSFMETFGRAKCGVGRPAHSVLRNKFLRVCLFLADGTRSVPATFGFADPEFGLGQRPVCRTVFAGSRLFTSRHPLQDQWETPDDRVAYREVGQSPASASWPYRHCKWNLQSVRIRYGSVLST